MVKSSQPRIRVSLFLPDGQAAFQDHNILMATEIKLPCHFFIREAANGPSINNNSFQKTQEKITEKSSHDALGLFWARLVFFLIIKSSRARHLDICFATARDTFG